MMTWTHLKGKMKDKKASIAYPRTFLESETKNILDSRRIPSRT